MARLLSAQAANDVEDVAINGDVSKTLDPLYKAFDGWRKRLYGGANIVDAGGAVLDRGVFHRALRAMPRKYLNRRGNLKWFTSAGLLTDYVYSAQFVEGVPSDTAQFRNADANDNNSFPGSAAGWTPTAPFGISATEVPLFPEYDNAGVTQSDLWLTDPQNLIWGVKKDIKVFREFKPRKDTIEFTMFTRVGASVENPNAAVLVRNIGYRA